MAPRDESPYAPPQVPRRLWHRNLSFLRDRALAARIEAAGHELRLALPGRAGPGEGDGVLVWGRTPVAARGERLAAATGAVLVRAEDAFLRGLRPGRQGGAAGLGLMLDPLGVHFDGRAPSLAEHLLAGHPLDDSNLLTRARDGMGRIAAMQLSKYNIHDITLPPPAPGYALVVDQTAGDASVTASGATRATFLEMLALARERHPRARILVKTHPETAAGLRPGHFGAADAGGHVELLAAPHAPRALLEGAVAVYTVSSQLGFEAILSGHRPVVFGTPVYAGWGLSEDRAGPIPRRGRALTRAQLFAALMILAPRWFDPCLGRPATFEQALDQLEAEVRAWREDRAGHVACGMRLWKRPHLAAFFGRERPLRFARTPARAEAVARAEGRGVLVWGAGAAPRPQGARAVEDGLLRSRGLGADLVPPLSLVADARGIYYDPTQPSDLEALIAAPPPPGAEARATRLVERIAAAGVTKYNLPGAALPPLPEGRRILVPGQVEDDASIRLGATGEVRTNEGLLRAVRAANPGAVILWKPHPDVEAGLRPGAVAEAVVAGLGAIPLQGVPAAGAIAAAEEVWTITSTLGFEALLRGRRVVCLGAPFYAGWGLTTDLAPVPDRRRRAPDGGLRPAPAPWQLAHAALIAYPRYRDPVSGLPCPAEVAVERLATGPIPAAGPANRLLAKAQGLLAGQAWLWRR